MKFRCQFPAGKPLLNKTVNLTTKTSQLKLQCKTKQKFQNTACNLSAKRQSV